MSKREYIQANKDWLEAKAKEEGVKALSKGIYYKILAEGDASSAQPTVRSIITAHYTGKTIRERPSTANCLKAAVAVSRWLAACVTLSRAGSSLCSRCISVTNGKYTFLQRWAMASSHSLVSLQAQH